MAYFALTHPKKFVWISSDACNNRPDDPDDEDQNNVHRRIIEILELADSNSFSSERCGYYAVSIFRRVMRCSAKIYNESYYHNKIFWHVSMKPSLEHTIQGRPTLFHERICDSKMEA